MVMMVEMMVDLLSLQRSCRLPKDETAKRKVGFMVMGRWSLGRRRNVPASTPARNSTNESNSIIGINA